MSIMQKCAQRHTKWGECRVKVRKSSKSIKTGQSRTQKTCAHSERHVNGQLQNKIRIRVRDSTRKDAKPGNGRIGAIAQHRYPGVAIRVARQRGGTASGRFVTFFGRVLFVKPSRQRQPEPSVSTKKIVNRICCLQSKLNLFAPSAGGRHPIL